MDKFEKAGIRRLTGEACSLYMRVLCDLTPEGEAVMNKFLGGNIKFVQGSNWNSGATSSIMLPYTILNDLEKFLDHCGPDRNTHQMSGRTV